MSNTITDVFFSKPKDLGLKINRMTYLGASILANIATVAITAAILPIADPIMLLACALLFLVPGYWIVKTVTARIRSISTTFKYGILIALAAMAVSFAYGFGYNGQAMAIANVVCVYGLHLVLLFTPQAEDID